MSIEELNIKVAKKVFDVEGQEVLLQLDFLLNQDANQIAEAIQNMLRVESRRELIRQTSAN